jgi:hypothetical protein
MKTTKKKISATLAVSIALVAATSACSTTLTSSTGSLSRVHIYNSLEELVSDTPNIIVGKVKASEVSHDEQLKMDVTLATVEVFNDSKAEYGDTVIVRQTGSTNSDVGSTYMQVNKVYAIFAVQSDQTAAAETEFDIRGVDAGIYEADGAVSTAAAALSSDATYHRLDAQTPDKLPATIHLSDIIG